MEHRVGKSAELTFLGGKKRLLFCGLGDLFSLFLLDEKRDVYCGQCCSWRSPNTEGSRSLADKAAKVEHEMLQTQLRREGGYPSLRNRGRVFIVTAFPTVLAALVHIYCSGGAGSINIGGYQCSGYIHEETYPYM